MPSEKWSEYWNRIGTLEKLQWYLLVVIVPLEIIIIIWGIACLQWFSTSWVG